MKQRTRGLGIVAVAALALALLVSCSSTSETSTGASSSGTTPGSTAAGGGTSATGSAGGVPTVANAPEKITIAYQLIPNADLVVKYEGWLEEALPDTEIEWKQFDSGGSVNEAIIAGSVDFGLAGSSPVSRGLSTGIEYQVPWIHDVIGDAEALVVKSDTVKSFADLKGKKIATPFASTAHFSLLAALEENGIAESDVEIIDAEPADIYAAWTRGDIDGAYVWNPNLASMLSEGGTTLITSADLAKKGKTTYDLAVVRNEFADAHADVVTLWASLQDRAVQLYRSDQTAFATAVGAELNLPVDEVTPQLEDLQFLTAKEQIGKDYLGGGLAANLYASAQFNQELGKIDEVLPASAYEDAVNASYAEAVAG
jgi:taurine transport system substrate-binding protein